MGNTVRVTAVNHVALVIACRPEQIYHEILSTYVEGGKFTAQGYEIAPLPDSDLTAFRGGYRITLKNDKGELVDHRICRITERDDEAYRVSLQADYLLPAQMGMTVHATYQAVSTPTGARYQLDCHSDMNIEPPSDNAKAGVAEFVTRFERQSECYLKAFLGQIKERLEAES